ncbi:MAG: S41 family peptidase [Chthoniobacterales bacterium]|nr:S41 family peptidase [Chthoniobacterales bacterium]
MIYRTAFTVLLAILSSAQLTIAQTAQPPGPVADFKLDEATRTQVLEQSLKHVRERYVFPDIGDAMEKALRVRIANKEYDGIESAAALAAKLTADLQAVSRDKHLRVKLVDPAAARARLPQDDAARREAAAVESRRGNHGFRRVERLAGNIGYIDLRAFSPARWAAEKAAAAMNLVADTEALIIDLRENGGGDPEMVALMVSYLLEGEPVHLNDFVDREGKVVSDFWTSKGLPGKLFVGKDVYVLTSGTTFSAAEGFAYDLTNLKRATLVGETTGGGANPVTMLDVGERFRIALPIGRARSPITQTNWEGAGVKPDISVPAKLALHTAHLAALTKLTEKNDSPSQSAALATAIERARKELEDLKAGGAG